MIDRKVLHYEIREQLGRGGMGVVYRAWDTRLERWVALKFLPQHANEDPLARQRFVREAKAASALEHPHICTIHEIGESEDGQLFICMAYYDGPNLRKAISHGEIKPARGFEIARQLCHAIARAHDAGIVHRDLKPSNIMTTRQGDVAIVDFGLAKLAGEISLTKTGATLGTTAYMSPEQIRGEELDYRTDLWSLGVIIYQLLTGRYPFKGDYDQALRRAILEDDPEPPSEVEPELPPHIDVFMARLLAKDRNERFGSAAEIEQLLLSLSRSEDTELPTQMVVPGAGSPPDRSRTARRFRWGVGAALLVILLVIAARLLPPGPPPRRAEPQSLAVLPFENFTGDPGKSYMSEGVANGLITALSELSGMTVLSRSEAWKNLDEDWGARRRGDELGVELLLEGDVYGKTDSLEITAKLIDVGTGSVVWSEEVQGATDDLPDLTRQIATRLTKVLSVRVSDREHRRLQRDPTQSFKAYEYYLRGQTYLSDKYQEADLEAAAELFRQAIRIDPDFALAHVALSEATWAHYMRDRDGALLQEAREEAERALEIDPHLPAAQVALARVQRSSGRPVDSIDALNDALRDHPNPDAAQRELALSYERAGDLERAETALRTATLIGADHWANWNLLGAFLWRKGDYDKAREAFLEAARVAPEGVYTPLRNLGGNEISRGNWEEAIRVLGDLPETEFSGSLASNLGTAYYFSDRPERLAKAREYYALAARLDPRDHAIRRNLADVELALDNQDAARAQYFEALRLIGEDLQNDPGNTQLRLMRGLYAARAEDCTTALEEADSLAASVQPTGMSQHHIAYVYALCGERERALGAISEAIELGVSPALIRREPEFESLYGDPAFRALVEADPAATRP